MTLILVPTILIVVAIFGIGGKLLWEYHKQKTKKVEKKQHLRQYISEFEADIERYGDPQTREKMLKINQRLAKIKLAIVQEGKFRLLMEDHPQLADLSNSLQMIFDEIAADKDDFSEHAQKIMSMEKALIDICFELDKMCRANDPKMEQILSEHQINLDDLKQGQSQIRQFLDTTDDLLCLK